MDFVGNLLSGSDNFFKYIFTVGFSMIILSLFYPLQKKHELQLEKALLTKDVELLKYHITALKEQVDYLKQKKLPELEKRLKVNKDDFNKGKKTNKQYIINKNNLISNFNSDYLPKKGDYSEAKIKEINLKYSNSKVLLLELQEREYSYYCNILLYSGTILSIIGFIGWIYVACLEIKKKRKEIDSI